MKPKVTIKFGQPSWRIATGKVEAFVTQTGGRVGLVTFMIGRNKIQPFSVASWADGQSVQLVAQSKRKNQGSPDLKFLGVENLKSKPVR